MRDDELSYESRKRIDAFLRDLAAMQFVPCGWCGAGLKEGALSCGCCGFPATYRGVNIRDFKRTKEQPTNGQR